MFTKIKQVWADHRAMNVIRNGNGDVHLVSFAGQDHSGWDCRLFQHEDEVSAPDPSLAILSAHKKIKQKK
jgi:hypothetical protein